MSVSVLQVSRDHSLGIGANLSKTPGFDLAGNV